MTEGLYQELISLTKKHLLSEEYDGTKVPCDTASYRYFIETKKPAAPAPVQSLPPPLPSAPPQKKLQPVVEVVVPTAAETVAAPLPPPPPVPEKKAAPKAAPKPAVVAPDFHEIKSLLKSLQLQVPLAKEALSDEEAQKKASQWKEKAPEVIVLSFFSHDSSKNDVVKNISSAIGSRLARCEYLHLPRKETMAEIALLAEHNLLKAVFLVSDIDTKAKVNELLLAIDLEEPTSKESSTLLSNRGTLHTTPFFDATISDTFDTDKAAKQQLWNAIKALVVS